MRSIAVEPSRPDAASKSTLQQVADAFGFGPVAAIDLVTEGLMNRNWRVITDAVQTPARVNVTCVTPLGEEVASIS